MNSSKDLKKSLEKSGSLKSSAKVMERYREEPGEDQINTSINDIQPIKVIEIFDEDKNESIMEDKLKARPLPRPIKK